MRSQKSERENNCDHPCFRAAEYRGAKLVMRFAKYLTQKSLPQNQKGI